MASLNESKAGTGPRTFEGTPAVPLNHEQSLRRAVMSCLLWENQFYESGIDIAQRIVDEVPYVKPEKVSAIAFQARTAMKLRHVPLLIARAMASCSPEHRKMVASTLEGIIQRPDELTEFLAIYWADGKIPLSAQIKKGLSRAFVKFNAFQLAKYNNQDKAVKLRDVLFMCHPKPKDAEQEKTWKQLVDKELATPDTWETNLSAGKDKKETFLRLMKENKLGALALLRNLRNMQESGIDLDTISEAILNMKVERVLPFRFITAARYAPQLESVLEKAMFKCLAGMPKLPGRTALIVDTSPSMWGVKVSAKSELDRFEAASALAILCRELCEKINIYAFNNRYYDIPDRHGFALRDALNQTKEGYSCGGLAVERANAQGYDRIIVLTDGEWHYKNGAGAYDYESGEATEVSPAPISDLAYMINVSSYKNAIGYGKWTKIDGWSEAILSYIAASEGINLND